MNISRPIVLSIAGFDPSGGAGILADIKTFETHKTVGLGVCSALTFQNDKDFDSVKWIPLEEIKKQIEVLSKRFEIKWVKIALIENLSVLEELVDYLKEKFKAQIIWDPILRASAGFIFHDQPNKESLINICKKVYMITPNFEEIKKMFPDLDEEASAALLSRFCYVFLKGGHREEKQGQDILFCKGKSALFEPLAVLGTSKHGSGCVLSSAILSNKAKGKTIEDACQEGKEYVTKFLLSDKNLIGYHNA